MNKITAIALNIFAMECALVAHAYNIPLAVALFVLCATLLLAMRWGFTGSFWK